MVFFTITLAIWVIRMKKLCKPTFENKDHGRGAGIPALKTIWDLFDLSLLFSQTGIRKHSGLPAGLPKNEEILAEIGTDMEQFPSHAHLASWAGMSPGNNESAGKRKSGRTTKGNKSLRATLVIAARSAAKSKSTYLSSQYHRIAARRGGNRAAVAVGHTILVMAYHILKKRQPYIELGADYFDQRKKNIVIKNALKRLESLGFKVTLESVA
jgi:hypothetical protein